MRILTIFTLMYALMCGAAMAHCGSCEKKAGEKAAAPGECPSQAGSCASLKAMAHPECTDGWTDVFNADLTNVVDPKKMKNIWSVDDGVITASKDVNLYTEKDYDNFIIDLEYKAGEAANSGIILYCSDIDGWVANSFEVQILDDESPRWAEVPANWKCGGIFGHKAPKAAAGKAAGEWNRMTIQCIDTKVDVVLNGQHVLSEDLKDYTDAAINPDGSEAPKWLSKPMATLPTKGKIGFQGKHGGANIWFRNMKIKELK